MELTQCIHRAAQGGAEGWATLCNGRQHSWPELRDRIARLAGAMRKVGVRPDDRVALLALNSDRYLEVMFATWWVGAVLVPMNIRWSVAENAYSLRDCGATTLFVDDTFLRHAADLQRSDLGIRTVFHMRESGILGDLIDYEAALAEATPIPDTRRGGDDIAGIFYTGGTTGFPKGVILPHRGLYVNGLGMMHAVSVGSESICLHAAPMFHVAEFTMALLTTFAGAKQVFLPSFDAGQVCTLTYEHAITHILLVPTMIKAVIEHPEAQKQDLSSLKLLLYGAAPITESLLHAAMQTLPGCGFVQAYGQTEVSPVATLLGVQDHIAARRKPELLRSAGRAAPFAEVEIANPDRQEVPRGTVGEIRVRGSGTMLGYWNKDGETTRTLADGWVYTGDAGFMDEDGYLFVVDRVKDMIVSGGENVYSAEVENALAKHPAVANCAVIGIPHEKWGEQVHALVILKDQSRASTAELIEHCRTLIAGYKCPRSIEFRSAPFPVSGAGKVLKRELRDPYWSGQSRRVS